MAFIDDRVGIVDSDISEMRDGIRVIKAGQVNMETKLNRVVEDVAELKASHIETRDLLAAILRRLEK